MLVKHLSAASRRARVPNFVRRVTRLHAAFVPQQRMRRHIECKRWFLHQLPHVMCGVLECTGGFHQAMIRKPNLAIGKPYAESHLFQSFPLQPSDTAGSRVAGWYAVCFKSLLHERSTMRCDTSCCLQLARVAARLPHADGSCRDSAQIEETLR